MIDFRIRKATNVLDGAFGHLRCPTSIGELENPDVTAIGILLHAYSASNTYCAGHRHVRYSTRSRIFTLRLTKSQLGSFPLQAVPYIQAVLASWSVR